MVKLEAHDGEWWSWICQPEAACCAHNSSKRQAQLVDFSSASHARYLTKWGDGPKPQAFQWTLQCLGQTRHVRHAWTWTGKIYWAFQFLWAFLNHQARNCFWTIPSQAPWAAVSCRPGGTQPQSLYLKSDEAEAQEASPRRRTTFLLFLKLAATELK